MERKTFIRTLSLGAVGGAVAGAEGLEAEEAGVTPGLAVGAGDTIIVNISDDLVWSEDEMSDHTERLKAVFGCKRVLIMQGVESLHVISPG